MKTLVLALAMTVSFGALASEKICFYSEGTLGGSKGDSFTANVSTTSLSVRNIKGEAGWEGSYKRSAGETVKGRDGKTYLGYYTGGEEGCSNILVDSKLLKNKGTGLIKMRCRGEGFGEDKFFCRDNRK